MLIAWRVKPSLCTPGSLRRLSEGRLHGMMLLCVSAVKRCVHCLA